MSNQVHTQFGTDATHDESDLTDQNDAPSLTAHAQATTAETNQEIPAVSELLALSREFNSAFNTTLYELENTRKLTRERAARIQELDDSIRTISGNLQEETRKSLEKDEEYAQKTEELERRIHETESVRDRLRAQTIEQEAALNAGADEADRLTQQIEELNSSLEQHLHEARHTRDLFAREKQALCGNIDELNESLRSVGSTLEEKTRKSRENDEEYARKSEELQRRIHETESERDRLRTQTGEQQEALQAGTEEAARLSKQIDELSSSLEQQRDEARQAREEYTSEKQTLTGTIDELNESLRSIGNTLEEETRKSRENDEEYVRKSEELQRRIHETESERDHLRTQTGEQQQALQAGAEETARLSQQIEELNTSLEQQLAEARQMREEFIREKDALTGSLEDLQKKYESTRNKLDNSLAEKEELGRQFEREQTAHQSTNSKLTAHVDNLQSLNRALHESIISDNEVREKLLEQKDGEIQTLLSNEGIESEQLKTALHEVETMLAETEAKRQALEERSRQASELESEVARLGTALQAAENTAQQNNADMQQLHGLNTQVAELEAALDTARAEGTALAGELFGHDSLKQEVTDLREALEHANGKLHEQQQADSGSEDANNEIATLKTALVAARVEGDALAGKLFHHESLTNEVAELRQSLQQANDRLQEQGDAGTRLEAQNNEISALKATLEAVQYEHGALTGKLHDQEPLEREVASLREALDQANGRLQEQGNSDATLQTLNNEVDSLKAALETAHDEHGALTSKLHDQEALERETASLREALEQANGKLQEQGHSDASLQTLNNEVDSLKAALETAHDEHGALAGKLHDQEALERETASLREALEQANGKLQDQAAPGLQDHGDTGTQLESLNNEVDSLKAALEAAHNERAALSGKLHNHDALEHEVTRLRDALEQTHDRVQAQGDTGARLEGLNNEVSALKAALAAAEEKCKQLQSTAENTSTPANSSAPAQVPVAATTDREQFIEHLNGLLDGPDSKKTNLTIMYVLMDNFIRIRDDIGIMNSEKVISEVTSIIKIRCNENDLVSRFGDCTFAVISRDTETDKTRDKAEKIRAEIENRIFEVAGHSVLTTTSIGICATRNSDENAELVIARADLACESARTSGGNQILVGSTVSDGIGMLGHQDSHPEIVDKILADNRIKIYYQSISSLKGQDSHCYEVLTRIVDEEGNIILPGEFFSMAINSDKAMDVDLYVVENIMRMMAENRDQPMTLFIKLTRQSVASNDFAVWVMEKIKHYMIKPENLVFEVAENMLQNELKNLSMLSMALHKIGCKVAIEHYRMSTQPQHLQHVHADYLKIDSGLIQNIGNKGKCLEKVTDIMAVARNKNYTTVAEGVESPACLAILWELGVNLAQGYFIQAPVGDMRTDTIEVKTDADDEDDSENTSKAKYIIG